MKKIVLLLFLSIIVLSCKSKKILVEQETFKIDTNIVIPADTVSSKVKVGKDTVITDTSTGIKTEIKFLDEEFKITTIFPEKVITIKGEKTISKYINPRLEKTKSRHDRKEKRDSLKADVKINKDSLKYDQKKNKDSLKSDVKKTRIENKTSFFDQIKTFLLWGSIVGVVIFVIKKFVLKK